MVNNKVVLMVSLCENHNKLPPNKMIVYVELLFSLFQLPQERPNEMAL